MFHCIQGDCEAGYYCDGGANTSAPSPSAAYPDNGVCPTGHYCPNGTKMWVQCPIGTYRASTSKIFITMYMYLSMFFPTSLIICKE
jgi:hypothetical protein